MATSQERTTMRGWSQTAPGLPETVLKLSSDLAFPSKIGPTEVLVEISHAALNPGSSLFIQLLPMIFRTKPSIPEMDFAGSLVAIGVDVPPSRDLSIGTKVFGSIPVGQYVGKGKGSMAEFVVVHAEQVCKIPANLPADQAAGLGIAGCSALTLLNAANLKEGDSVLLNAASGGIGSLTLQMVKNAVGENGRVVAICSGGNTEMVEGLGADEVIDYKVHASVPAHLTTMCSNGKEFDIIIDCLGNQDLYVQCASYLKTGKPYVTIGLALPGPTSWGTLMWTLWKMMGNALWPRMLGGIDRQWLQVTALANLRDFEQLSFMASEGKLKVPMDSIWEMEDSLKAYERMLSKHARGKVIVRVKSSD